MTDVRRWFGTDTRVDVLRGVSLTAGAGQLTAIVGPSGSGKTTLLNLLGLLDTPSEGTYLLSGEHIGTKSRTQLDQLRAEKLGFVFQAFHLVAGKTVVDNVALGSLYQGVRTKVRYRQAVRLLGELGLDHRLGALPNTLSGGEMQRVAIARALMGNPEVLLCDEPTGNLDVEATSRVVDLLERMRDHGLCVIVVSHDPAVAARADQVLRLRAGHIHVT